MTATSGLIGGACRSLRSSRSTSLRAAGESPASATRAHVPGDVLVGGLAGLLDLVAQHAQLLVQQQLALRALDALLHLEADLLLDAEHGVLLGQALEQGEEALLRVPISSSACFSPVSVCRCAATMSASSSGSAACCTTNCTSSASCGCICT